MTFCPRVKFFLWYFAIFSILWDMVQITTEKGIYWFGCLECYLWCCHLYNQAGCLFCYTNGCVYQPQNSLICSLSKNASSLPSSILVSIWSNDLVTYKNRPIPWNATFLMPSSPQSPLLLPEMQPFSQCLFLCNLQSRLLCANLLHRAVKIFWGLALIFHLIIVVSAKGQCCHKFIFDN